MMIEEDYNQLKDCFISSQILFDKLNLVAINAKELDYDESGLYQDDEDMYKRHWLKLSSKIVDKMSETLSNYKIELLNNSELTTMELRFNLVQDDEISKISVDYSEKGALCITQNS